MEQVTRVRARHSADQLRPKSFRNYLILSAPFAATVFFFSSPLSANINLSQSVIGLILLGAAFILLLTAAPIFKSAISQLSAGAPGGAVLAAAALLALFGVNAAGQVGQWWQFALVVELLLLGNWRISQAFRRLARIEKVLADLLPVQATLLIEPVQDNSADEFGSEEAAEEAAEENAEETPQETVDQTIEVSVDELSIGSVVQVRPGQIVPADGIVLLGSADVDEFAITGSAAMVYKSEGAKVWAGSRLSDDAPLGQGVLNIQVERAGSATALATHHEILLAAEDEPSKLQAKLEQAANWAFYLAAGTAVVVLAIGLITNFGDQSNAWLAFAAVLLVFSPQTLRLVVGPLMVAALDRAAKRGLLVRNRAAFEALSRADAVAFDKTGILTTAERSFVRARLAHNSPLQNVDELIALAAGVEVFAKHSVAARIVAEAKMRRLDIPEILDFRVIPGQGVTGILDGSTVIVGGAGLLTGRNIEIFVGDLVQADQANNQGNSVIFVIRDTQLLGYIELSDIIRPNAQSAVTALHLRKKRVVLITGDAIGVANFVAGQLGAAEVFGELVPMQKAKAIEQLKADGSLVAMVGDAENDLESLAQADISIAVGVEVQVVQQSADLILTTENPMAVVHAVDLSIGVRRAIRANLGWFGVVSVGSLLLAGGLFSAAGLPALPTVAALFSFVPSAIVAANAAKFQK